MCHHELWPTSVSHPFSSLNSSLGFAGGKHFQKITIPIFRLVPQNLDIPGCFPYILFYCYLFSWLSSGWFVIAVCGSISIAGTLGCVFIDNETHESGVTKCTTGEAWSAFSGHHSSVFHCQWTHNQVFLLLSHMLIWNAKNIFIYVMKYVSGFIWKLGINFAVCIKWIDEMWWNSRLLLVPNCYEVVAMVATMVAMVAPLWCHTLR